MNIFIPLTDGTENFILLIFKSQEVSEAICVVLNSPKKSLIFALALAPKMGQNK